MQIVLALLISIACLDSSSAQTLSNSAAISLVRSLLPAFISAPEAFKDIEDGSPEGHVYMIELLLASASDEVIGVPSNVWQTGNIDVECRVVLKSSKRSTYVCDVKSSMESADEDGSQASMTYTLTFDRIKKSKKIVPRKVEQLSVG